MQSSTYSRDGEPASAAHAVDGDLGTSTEAGDRCTLTHHHPEPWWAVDLGQVYTLDYVTLTNRDEHGKPINRRCYKIIFSWENNLMLIHYAAYRKTSNMSHTLVGNKIVDHSDVVGVSPVGATTSPFSTLHLTSIYRTNTTARWVEKYSSFGIWCGLY